MQRRVHVLEQLIQRWSTVCIAINQSLTGDKHDQKHSGPNNLVGALMSAWLYSLNWQQHPKLDGKVTKSVWVRESYCE